MKFNIINLTNPLITKSEKVHIESSSDILNVLEQIEPYYKDYGLTTDDYKIIKHFENYNAEKRLIELPTGTEEVMLNYIPQQNRLLIQSNSAVLCNRIEKAFSKLERVVVVVGERDGDNIREIMKKIKEKLPESILGYKCEFDMETIYFFGSNDNRLWLQHEKEFIILRTNVWSHDYKHILKKLKKCLNSIESDNSGAC